MSRLRVFLDSCVLIEGLACPWSNSHGLLILGRTLFTIVLAEIVQEETERALHRKLQTGYRGDLLGDYRRLMQRLVVERVPHVSRQEFEQGRSWIRHQNDVPVLAAAVQARPDWLLTANTSDGHFDAAASERTGIRFATPKEFLALLRPSL